MLTWAKMIPYLRIENLKNHTLSLGTYLYSQYVGVTPGTEPHRAQLASRLMHNLNVPVSSSLHQGTDSELQATWIPLWGPVPTTRK